MPSRRGAWVAFGLAVFATAYAPALTLSEQGVAAAFRYFAADAFYYLAVADHSAGAAFYTFDGRFPTNGFHPLWQYYLTFAFAKLELTREGPLLFAFGSSVLFTALGTGLFAAAMQRVTGSVAIALVACVPGFYYLLLPSLNVHYFAQWSFANGMESSLSVLFFGLLSFLLVNRSLLAAPSLRRVLLLSTLLTLLTLSRLDDVFVFVPFGMFLWLSSGRTSERVSRAAAFGAVPLVCIGAYLAYNVSYAGTLMPVSGAAKNEGLAFGLLRNGYALVTTLLPFVDPFGRGNAAWGSEAWRVLQMVLPAGAAVAWVAATWSTVRLRPQDERGARRLALTLLCVYVILKAGYNFALVRLWHQGQWYYPVSIMTFDWIVAATLAAGLERLRARAPEAEARGRPAAALGLAAVLVFVLLQANAFAEAKRSGGFGLGNYRFWERREAIGRDLERVCPGCGVVEFDDGILSYSLPMPVMSGIGLTLDKAAFDAQQRGELLDMAWERGFRVLATLNYPMPAGTYSDPERLRLGLSANDQLRGQKLEGWDFETVHVDPESRVAFVVFRPKPGKP